MIDINYFKPQPGTKFDYVIDEILWNDIFKNPFSVDLSCPEKNKVTLSDYFFVQPLTRGTLRGPKKISPKKNFFLESYAQEKEKAFIGLVEFLDRYSRPCSNYHILVPRHQSNPLDPIFSPLNLYFKDTVYPSINAKENLLEVKFNAKLFLEVHSYVFGQYAEIQYPETRTLLFHCSTFRSFVLHY